MCLVMRVARFQGLALVLPPASVPRSPGWCAGRPHSEGLGQRLVVAALEAGDERRRHRRLALLAGGIGGGFRLAKARSRGP